MPSERTPAPRITSNDTFATSGPSESAESAEPAQVSAPLLALTPTALSLPRNVVPSTIAAGEIIAVAAQGLVYNFEKPTGPAAAGADGHPNGRAQTEASPPLISVTTAQSRVTALAICADSTAVAAGHETGHILIWDVSRPSRPLLTIPPYSTAEKTRNSLASSISGSLSNSFLGTQPRRGHAEGSAITHLSFVSRRRTAVVAADDDGMAFAHLAGRGLSKAIESVRLLGHYPGTNIGPDRVPNGLVLGVSGMPFSGHEGGKDGPEERAGRNGVALLTERVFCVLGAVPPATYYRERVTFEEGEEITGGLSFCASPPQLAYAAGRRLEIVRVTPALDVFKLASFQSESPIFSVEWMQPTIVACLLSGTVSILELVAVLEESDSESIFSSWKVVVRGRVEINATKMVASASLFFLTPQFIVARARDWASRVKGLAQADPAGALDLAGWYLSNQDPLSGLPTNPASRRSLVVPAIRSLVKTARVEDKRTMQAVFRSCIAVDKSLLFESVYERCRGPLFFSEMVEGVIAKNVELSPVVARDALIWLIERIGNKEATPKSLEAIVLETDATVLDLDLIDPVLCRLRLWAGLACLWSKLGDPICPVLTMVDCAKTAKGTVRDDILTHLFKHIEQALVGRVYPTGENLPIPSRLPEFLLGGRENERYQHLRTLLELSPSRLFSSLDSFLEDPSLDEGLVSRQEVLALLGGLVSEMDAEMDGSSGPSAAEIEYVLFTARTIGKFPQHVLVPESKVKELVGKLERYAISIREKENSDSLRVDATTLEQLQLATEFVAQRLPPPLSPTLSPSAPCDSRAGFHRIARSAAAGVSDWAGVLRSWISEMADPLRLLEPTTIVNGIEDALRKGHKDEQVVSILQSQAERIISVDPESVGKMLRRLQDSSINLAERFCAVLEDEDKFPVLCGYFGLAGEGDAEVEGDGGALNKEFFKFEDVEVTKVETAADHALLEIFIPLLARFKSERLCQFLFALEDVDEQLLELIPVLDAADSIDGGVLLEIKAGKKLGGTKSDDIGSLKKNAVQKIANHLTMLEPAIKELDKTDGDSTETTDQLSSILDEVRRYVGLGVWVCQQTREGKGVIEEKESSVSDPAWSLLIGAVIKLVVSSLSPEDQHSPPTGTALKHTLTQATSALELSGRFAPVFELVLRSLSSSSSSAGAAGPSSTLTPTLLPLLSSIFSSQAHTAAVLQVAKELLGLDIDVAAAALFEPLQAGWGPRADIRQGGQYGEYVAAGAGRCAGCSRPAWGAGANVWDRWVGAQAAARPARRGRSGTAAAAEKAGAAAAAAAMLSLSSLGGGCPGMPVPSSSGRRAAGQDGGGVVVFACRHAYHQACLSRISERYSVEGQQEAAGASASASAPVSDAGTAAAAEKGKRDREPNASGGGGRKEARGRRPGPSRKKVWCVICYGFPSKTAAGGIGEGKRAGPT